MEILVAIDLSGGRVVRLTRGQMAEKTVYADDPVKTAADWRALGARFLHLVDLDAATGAGPGNEHAIAEVLSAMDLPVQVGGGIRSQGDIERWLDLGAARVCVGSRSMDEKFLSAAAAEFGEGLVVSIDAKDSVVQVAGWTESSGVSVPEAVKMVTGAGARRIMFTDISRDGTLTGPNVAATAEVASLAGVPVIASGGVSGPEDLKALAAEGLEAAVVGRALYAGTMTLDEALRAAG